MAKKGNRQLISLDCSVCKNRNYVSQKNIVSTKDKISLNKFCNKCRRTTVHNEGKIQ